MKSPRDYTRTIYFINRFLGSPLEAMFTLLIFILSKELNADLLQLTVLASTKSIASLLAFFVSSIISKNTHRIKEYLISLNIIGCLPCLLFPFMENTWFYIISYILFMTALRSTLPAWSEILKVNLGTQNVADSASKGSSINYSITIFIPLLLSFWMDQNSEIWKFLFFGLAFIQILNTVSLLCLRWKPQNEKVSSTISMSTWKEVWAIYLKRKDFISYLALFFLGGAGLVMIQPILPLFFKDNLQLSYQQLTLAISFCKGIAFVLTSSWWARWTIKNSIFSLNSSVNLLSCLFIAFLLASELNTQWIFLAFSIFGIIQSGSELSLNASASLFSKKDESILYSGMNLAVIGIRGCIFPVLGQLLFAHSNAWIVFITAGILCFLSLLYGLFLNRRYSLNLKKAAS